MNSSPPLTIRSLPDGQVDLGVQDGERLRFGPSGRRLSATQRIMQAAQKVLASQAQARAEKDGKVALGDYNVLVKELLNPRMNVRAQQIEVNGRLLSDAAFENLHVSLAAEYDFKFRKSDLQSSLRAMAEESLFDPVAEELNALGGNPQQVLTDDEWQQIAQLAFGVEGEFEREVLQKWLISCVARVFEPGCKVDQALVLKGKQGLGKSSFFSILGGRWFNDSLGDLSNEKDDRLLIARFWISEWSEVDQVFAGARKAEKVKQVITAQFDNFRAPYGRTTESHPRRGVLVGTTNRDDFLNDHTGNRRFPVLEPKDIDREWLAENRGRIWARAVVEYRKGAQWHFSSQQEQEFSKRALAYAPEDEALDQVLAFLKLHTDRWFNTRELAELALQREPERIDQTELNRLARRLERLSAFGVQVERRFHIAPNPKHGKGSKKCFLLPLNAITHNAISL